MTRKPVQSAMIGFLLVIMVSSCNSGLLKISTATSTPTANDSTLLTLPKVTPYSLQPAAGICAASEVEMVTVQLNPDLPDPRCIKVRAGQKLTVVNNSSGTLQVSLGVFHFNLSAGETHTIDWPFSDYLEPGVHQLMVLPCCSAEVWLEGN